MKTKADYLIYCDESCPLEHESITLFGAISCSAYKKNEIVNDLRELKKKHFNGNSRQETKWIKISKSKLDYYKELIDYFYDNNDLRIRIIVAKNKQKLNNIKYNAGDYQQWYYKMYYYLLDLSIDPNYGYFMMYDEKDKYTTYRMNMVRDIINNKKNFSLYNKNFQLKIKQIDSKESEIMQVLDVVMGAIGYTNRGFMNNLELETSSSKKILVEHLSNKFNRDLHQKTSPFEPKFNIFIWNPR